VFQPIVDFHRDDNDDWVAVLGCLHFQHVRHDPPWQNREWVTTPAGRIDHLGQMLRCVKCSVNAPLDAVERATKDEPRIPVNLQSYKKTPVFDQNSVPKGLQKEHATASGVWALLHVHTGSLSYCFTHDAEAMSCEVTPDRPRVIVAEQVHHVDIIGPVSFQLEFFRKPRGERA